MNGYPASVFDFFGRLNSDGQGLGGGIKLNGNGGFRKTLQELLGVCLAAHDREPQPCPPGEIGRSFKLEQVFASIDAHPLGGNHFCRLKARQGKTRYRGEQRDTHGVAGIEIRFFELGAKLCRRQHAVGKISQSAAGSAVRNHEEFFAGLIGRTNKPIAGLAREQFDPSNALIIRGDVHCLPNFRGFIVRIGKAPRAVFTQGSDPAAFFNCDFEPRACFGLEIAVNHGQSHGGRLTRQKEPGGLRRFFDPPAHGDVVRRCNEGEMPFNSASPFGFGTGKREIHVGKAV